MKLRLAAATLLLAVLTTACTTNNPVAPAAPGSARMDNGNWLGSGS